MKFDSTFLVRVVQLTLSEWICLCPSVSIKAFGNTKVESIEAVKIKLENYVRTHGTQYINDIGKGSEGVSCPEGLLDLPFDVWKCKLDKQLCALQAWIPLDDEKRFKAGCHASEQRKDQIYQVIQKGIYKGVHHKPGRYLCPTCHVKHSYHYSWELTSIENFIDVSSQDLILTLYKNKIDIAVTFSNICPHCFMKTISLIKPELTSELETIKINFTNELPQAFSDERFREKANRDFVSSYLETTDQEKESFSENWLLGLALAALFDDEEISPDYGDAITLAGNWLGLTDEEVDEICNDEDETRVQKLHELADSIAWRAGWTLLCGGLKKLATS